MYEVYKQYVSSRKLPEEIFVNTEIYQKKIINQKCIRFISKHTVAR